MQKEEKNKILEELGGLDECIYDDLVKMFIEQTENKIKNLDLTNYEELKNIFHSIKGSSSNLRLYKVNEVTKELENLVKANEDIEKIKDNLKILKQELDNLKSCFSQL